MPAYSFYVDGFSGIVSSLDELKARICDLKGRYPDLIGKDCKIMKGEAMRDGSGYYFPGDARLRIVRTITA